MPVRLDSAGSAATVADRRRRRRKKEMNDEKDVMLDKSWTMTKRFWEYLVFLQRVRVINLIYFYFFVVNIFKGNVLYLMKHTAPVIACSTKST